MIAFLLALGFAATVAANSPPQLMRVWCEPEVVDTSFAPAAVSIFAMLFDADGDFDDKGWFSILPPPASSGAAGAPESLVRTSSPRVVSRNGTEGVIATTFLLPQLSPPGVYQVAALSWYDKLDLYLQVDATLGSFQNLAAGPINSNETTAISNNDTMVPRPPLYAVLDASTVAPEAAQMTGWSFYLYGGPMILATDDNIAMPAPQAVNVASSYHATRFVETAGYLPEQLTGQMRRLPGWYAADGYEASFGIPPQGRPDGFAEASARMSYLGTRAFASAAVLRIKQDRLALGEVLTARNVSLVIRRRPEELASFSVIPVHVTILADGITAAQFAVTDGEEAAFQVVLEAKQNVTFVFASADKALLYSYTSFALRCEVTGDRQPATPEDHDAAWGAAVANAAAFEAPVVEKAGFNETLVLFSPDQPQGFGNLLFQRAFQTIENNTGSFVLQPLPPQPAQWQLYDYFSVSRSGGYYGRSAAENDCAVMALSMNGHYRLAMTATALNASVVCSPVITFPIPAGGSISALRFPIKIEDAVVEAQVPARLNIYSDHQLVKTVAIPSNPSEGSSSRRYAKWVDVDLPWPMTRFFAVQLELDPVAVASLGPEAFVPGASQQYSRGVPRATVGVPYGYRPPFSLYSTSSVVDEAVNAYQTGTLIAEGKVAHFGFETPALRSFESLLALDTAVVGPFSIPRFFPDMYPSSRIKLRRYQIMSYTGVSPSSWMQSSTNDQFIELPGDAAFVKSFGSLFNASSVELVLRMTVAVDWMAIPSNNHSARVLVISSPGRETPLASIRIERPESFSPGFPGWRQRQVKFTASSLDFIFSSEGGKSGILIDDLMIVQAGSEPPFVDPLGQMEVDRAQTETIPLLSVLNGSTVFPDAAKKAGWSFFSVGGLVTSVSVDDTNVLLSTLFPLLWTDRYYSGVSSEQPYFFDAYITSDTYIHPIVTSRGYDPSFEQYALFNPTRHSEEWRSISDSSIAAVYTVPQDRLLNADPEVLVATTVVFEIRTTGTLYPVKFFVLVDSREVVHSATIYSSVARTTLTVAAMSNVTFLFASGSSMTGTPLGLRAEIRGNYRPATTEDMITLSRRQQLASGAGTGVVPYGGHNGSYVFLHEWSTEQGNGGLYFQRAVSTLDERFGWQSTVPDSPAAWPLQDVPLSNRSNQFDTRCRTETEVVSSGSYRLVLKAVLGTDEQGRKVQCSPFITFPIPAGSSARGIEFGLFSFRRYSGALPSKVKVFADDEVVETVDVPAALPGTRFATWISVDLANRPQPKVARRYFAVQVEIDAAAASLFDFSSSGVSGNDNGTQAMMPYMSAMDFPGADIGIPAYLLPPFKVYGEMQEADRALHVVERALLFYNTRSLSFPFEGPAVLPGLDSFPATRIGPFPQPFVASSGSPAILRSYWPRGTIARPSWSQQESNGQYVELPASGSLRQQADYYSRLAGNIVTILLVRFSVAVDWTKVPPASPGGNSSVTLTVASQSRGLSDASLTFERPLNWDPVYMPGWRQRQVRIASDQLDLSFSASCAGVLLDGLAIVEEGYEEPFADPDSAAEERASKPAIPSSEPRVLGVLNGATILSAAVANKSSVPAEYRGWSFFSLPAYSQQQTGGGGGGGGNYALASASSLVYSKGIWDYWMYYYSLTPANWRPCYASSSAIYDPLIRPIYHPLLASAEDPATATLFGPSYCNQLNILGATYTIDQTASRAKGELTAATSAILSIVTNADADGISSSYDSSARTRITVVADGNVVESFEVEGFLSRALVTREVRFPSGAFNTITVVVDPIACNPNGLGKTAMKIKIVGAACSAGGDESPEGPNLLLNPGFEVTSPPAGALQQDVGAWFDATALAGWEVRPMSNIPPTRISLSSSSWIRPVEGRNSVEIRNGGLAQRLAGLTAGAKYKLSYAVAADCVPDTAMTMMGMKCGTSVTLTVRINDNDLSQYNGGVASFVCSPRDNPVWRTHEVFFIAPSADLTLALLNYQPCAANVDRLSLTKDMELLVNGEFEEPYLPFGTHQSFVRSYLPSVIPGWSLRLNDSAPSVNWVPQQLAQTTEEWKQSFSKRHTLGITYAGAQQQVYGLNAGSTYRLRLAAAADWIPDYGMMFPGQSSFDYGSTVSLVVTVNDEKIGEATFSYQQAMARLWDRRTNMLWEQHEFTFVAPSSGVALTLWSPNYLPLQVDAVSLMPLAPAVSGDAAKCNFTVNGGPMVTPSSQPTPLSTPTPMPTPSRMPFANTPRVNVGDLFSQDQVDPLSKDLLKSGVATSRGFWFQHASAQSEDIAPATATPSPSASVPATRSALERGHGMPVNKLEQMATVASSWTDWELPSAAGFAAPSSSHFPSGPLPCVITPAFVFNGTAIGMTASTTLGHAFPGRNGTRVGSEYCSPALVRPLMPGGRLYGVEMRVKALRTATPWWGFDGESITNYDRRQAVANVMIYLDGQLASSWQLSPPAEWYQQETTLDLSLDFELMPPFRKTAVESLVIRLEALPSSDGSPADASAIFVAGIEISAFRLYGRGLEPGSEMGSQAFEFPQLPPSLARVAFNRGPDTLSLRNGRNLRGDTSFLHISAAQGNQFLQLRKNTQPTRFFFPIFFDGSSIGGNEPSVFRFSTAGDWSDGSLGAKDISVALVSAQTGALAAGWPSSNNNETGGGPVFTIERPPSWDGLRRPGWKTVELRARLPQLEPSLSVFGGSFGNHSQSSPLFFLVFSSAHHGVLLDNVRVFPRVSDAPPFNPNEGAITDNGSDWGSGVAVPVRKPGTTLSLPLQFVGASLSALQANKEAFVAALKADVSRLLSFLRVAEADVDVDFCAASSSPVSVEGVGSMQSLSSELFATIPVSVLFRHGAHGGANKAKEALNLGLSTFASLFVSGSEEAKAGVFSRTLAEASRLSTSWTASAADSSGSAAAPRQVSLYLDALASAEGGVWIKGAAVGVGADGSLRPADGGKR